MADVVGSKSDAAQTTVGTTRSLMAYVKAILARITAEVAHKSTTVLHECTYPSVATVTSGVANTYGAYVQVHAAPGYDIELAGIYVSPSAAGNLSVAVEVAKGEAASEVPVATVAFVAGISGTATATYIPFKTPILIANARLAVRSKAGNTTVVANVVPHWRRVS